MTFIIQLNIKLYNKYYNIICKNKKVNQSIVILVKILVILIKNTNYLI